MGKSSGIPQPPGVPFLGNLFDIDMELPLKSLYDLADKHGEIYRMRFPGHTFIIANSYAMVNEFCDERRFPKTIFALKEMRHAIHDGLFTAIDDKEEPNWGIAHRILVPAFGPSSLRAMFDGMYDVASQLALKWARYGTNSPITVTDDFTRLTLDTIALCSMDFRFNSYYKDGVHPFVEAMSNFLTESGDRARRLPIPSLFYRGKDKKFFRDIEVMRETADGILQERKREKNLDTRKDLLSAMLNGVDPKTGRKMSEQSILDNLITFLIAGHETTSGTLSFALYHLMKHPEMYRRAQQEVDDVCGKTPIKFEHLSQLSYISAVLRETLRLTPPLPVFNVAPKQDEIVGGKYVVRAGELIIVLVGHSHLDPKVYGDDVLEFQPERMLDDNFDRLNKEFPNAWKPFGNATRACIGRPFAWQEALLVLAMLLQNFDFEFDDPDYTLKLKQTLTVKPANFQVRAIPRDGLKATELGQRLAGTTPVKTTPAAEDSEKTAAGAESEDGQPMRIYYGSNSGTCQSMAERLAANAFSHGFRATLIDSLDHATAKLPTDEPVVIITASYEGQPPDNAAHFVPWLESLPGADDLKDVAYAVFGCGNRDWVSTFHRIPRLVDAKMEQHGASRVAALGLSDVAAGRELTDFEAWEDEVLWPALRSKYHAAIPEAPALSVQVTSPRKSTLHQDVQEASVIGARTLTTPDASVTKASLELQLPPDTTYTAGDYVAVLPVNPQSQVHRVLRHFHLPWDAHLTISAHGLTPLPDNVSLPAVDIFGSYVELAQPATKRNVLTLAEAAQDLTTRDALQHLATDEGYTGVVAAGRLSVLDLLESHKGISLPISSFLRMLPAMRVRQYSIGSSPLCSPGHVVLTYSLLDEPTLSDHGKRHVGVATSYLATLQAGDVVHVSVRPAHAAFHLPTNPSTTPIVMIAAGTGIAPFRGFIQERASLQDARRAIAPALLYFGCRDPTQDDLYRDELDEWQADGVVTVRRAYSRRQGDSAGCRHVQDRLWRDRDAFMELWDRGAQVYICGSRAVGESVKAKLVDIFLEAAVNQGEGTTRDEVMRWFEGLKNTRYAVEVFD